MLFHHHHCLVFCLILKFHTMLSHAWSIISITIIHIFRNYPSLLWTLSLPIEIINKQLVICLRYWSLSFLQFLLYFLRHLILSICAFVTFILLDCGIFWGYTHHSSCIKTEVSIFHELKVLLIEQLLICICQVVHCFHV